MSRPNRVPAHARALIAALSLMLGTSASGSDLHLADPPSDVYKEHTVCSEDYLNETDLYAKICTTIWRNSLPNGVLTHAHVAASVKNLSTQQKSHYLHKIEIVVQGAVKVTCNYKNYLKPNQIANCADGMGVSAQLPNMRVSWDWATDEV